MWKSRLCRLRELGAARTTGDGATPNVHSMYASVTATKWAASWSALSSWASDSG